jgi:ribonucleoside-diphosphate reductase alpha chain
MPQDQHGPASHIQTLADTIASEPIRRLFTTEGRDPLARIEFGPRDVRLAVGDKTIYELKGGIFAKNMSDNAATIVASKYLRRTGVPSNTIPVEEHVRDAPIPIWICRRIATPNATFGGETDVRQVYRRLAGGWTYAGWRQGVFADETEARTFHDEVLYMLAAQMAAPNSPQWFNSGLHWAYGIAGPAQGHWWAEVQPDGTMTSAPSTSAYERPQVSACYITKIKDDLVNDGGILDFVRREGRIFKYGSGSGANFSALRADGEALSGGGKSSGLMSFLKVPDVSAGSIKSGGTTRRAAKMVVLDDDHPDVEAYVAWKAREEHKVAALVSGSLAIRKYLKPIHDALPEIVPEHQEADLAYLVDPALDAGVPPAMIDRVFALGRELPFDTLFPLFDANWEGDAYNTVSGQNSNNSVMATDRFLSLIDTDEDWPLTARTTGKPLRTIKARALWDQICRAAWMSADPGLMFDGTLQAWHTCPAGGRIRATNPCAEYIHLEGTACTLASLRLTAFLTVDGYLLLESLVHAAALWTIVLDISVGWGQQPDKEMAEQTALYRTIGLGTADLGGVLMRASIPYDSDAGRAVAGILHAVLGGSAQLTSAWLADRLGAFPRYADNAQAMARVIANHRALAEGSPADMLNSPLPIPRDLRIVGFDDAAQLECMDHARNAATALWRAAAASVSGYRNAQVTVIAPTGTIGMAMDCDTLGIEPDFSLVRFKQLAGGGYMKLVNNNVAKALDRLGYAETENRDILAHITGHGTLRDAPGIDIAALEARGFSHHMIAQVEAALASASSVSAAISAFVIGDEGLVALGLDPTAARQPGFDLPTALGFGPDQIAAATRHACGHNHLEGAPHLKPEHLAVFDCANKAGDGTRSLSVDAHITMMSAVQSFVSGGISKTVNLPHDATVADVDHAYRLAYTRGIKAVALFRDGSKLSQPVVAQRRRATTTPRADAAALSQPAASAALPAAPTAASPILQRGQRERLPDYRLGYTRKFKVGGVGVYVRTGEYEDGRLGEIFVTINKNGDAFGSMMNMWATEVSVALQYGKPLRELLDTYVGQKFEPSGQVENHPYIKLASSIVDAIVRDLALHYLQDFDYANIRPTAPATQLTPVTPRLTRLTSIHETLATYRPRMVDRSGAPVAQLAADVARVPLAALAPAPKPNGHEHARSAGYDTSVSCKNCGERKMRRTGSCLTCSVCGTPDGGCS